MNNFNDACIELSSLAKFLFNFDIELCINFLLVVFISR